MPAEISPVHPEKIAFLSTKSVDLLKSAHNPFFGAFDALDKARKGDGTIYEIRDGERIIGCFYIRFVFNHLGKVMELMLLGGEQGYIEKYRQALSDFCWQMFRKEKASEFVYMGREGFARLFPWLEKICSVYRYDHSKI